MTNRLPPGFVLEQPAPLPPGFVPEQQQAEQQPPMQSASPRGTRAAQLRQQRELEREQFLSSLNPYQRELIESTSPAEAALIAAGKGFRDIGVGIGVADAPSEFDRQTMQRLETAYPTAVPLGEFAGQAAPFVVPGLGAAAIPSQAGRVAAMTGLGAAESAILARAEGRSLGEQLFAAGIGGTVAGALELALPHFGRLGGQFIRRATGQRATQAAFDNAGNPSDELIDALAREDKTLDEFINEEIKKETERKSSSLATSDVIEEETIDIKFDYPQSKAKVDDIKSVIDTIKGSETKGATQKAAEVADIDYSIIDAGKMVGVDVPIASASTNRAFVEAAQAGKSVYGNALGLEEADAIAQSKEAAAKLIRGLRGGEEDVSIFDTVLEQNFESNIERLKGAANNGFNIVRRAIPEGTPADITNIERYVDKVLNVRYGGDEKSLTKEQRELLRLVRRAESEDTEVTYDALDKVRREIGRGFSEKGRYRYQDQKELAESYAAISKDQKAIAEANEVGDAYAEANKVVQDYKNLELIMNKLFRNDMSRSVVPQLKDAANSLVKGNKKTFNNLMSRIPDKFKQDAAAIVLQDIMESGARTSDGLSEGFAKSFAKFNKQKTAKEAVFKYLPKQALTDFNNLGVAWTALIRSKALENKSKTARDMLFALDKGGALEKIMSWGTKAAAMETVGTLVAGSPGVGSVLATSVEMYVQNKKKSSAQSTQEFITSDKFADAVKAYAAAPAEAAKKADDKLRKTKKYKEWAKYLPDADRKRIEEIGFVPYLIEPVQKTAPVIGAAAAQQPEQE
jgi:hypothetical protein